MGRSDRCVIVGGGLAGALLAVYLARDGHEVDVYEMRDDLRRADVAGGRSINLAISHRGLEALRPVGLAEEVLRAAVPMRGRMIHPLTGPLTFQPYDKDPTRAINSVSRAGLNALLLNAAASHPNVRLHFKHKCVDVDFDKPAVRLLDLANLQPVIAEGDVVYSADGAFSSVRAAMQKRPRFNYSQTYENYGYKELRIPSGDAGSFRIERNALHIWPRRSYMMIALPNIDGSFTCTLFWPYEGEASFAAIRGEADLRGFFARVFPDAVPHMPSLVEDYFHNPVGSLATVRCGPWMVEDKVAILGDAAHAVVPFYGQGANASFEDVVALSECLRENRGDRRRALTTFYERRKPNADAIADLALSNFVEMRDKTTSHWFHWRKRGEKLLHRRLPRWYVPLYTMVSFTSTPYAEAVRVSKRQDRVVVATALVILIVLLAALAAWVT